MTPEAPLNLLQETHTWRTPVLMIKTMKSMPINLLAKYFKYDQKMHDKKCQSNCRRLYRCEYFIMDYESSNYRNINFRDSPSQFGAYISCVYIYHVMKMRESIIFISQLLISWYQSISQNGYEFST